MTLYRQFSNQEELDWEYMPEKRINDPAAFDKIVEWRRAQSAQAKRELEHVVDISYGPTLIEKLDIYPVAKANAPIAIFIHGGYWHNARLTKEIYSWTAKGFAGHGVTTVVLDYAVCPAVTIDEIVRQCRAAVAWVYRNAETFGGDRSRIYVTGNSAGGHLTAMLVLTDWAGEYGLPPDVVAGGCPISGLFDLEPFPYTWLQPKIQLTGQQIKRNSPILHVRENGVPLLISWGSEESPEFWRQSEAFGAAWLKKGNSTKMHAQEGRNHFDANCGLADAESPLCRLIVEHMRECWSRSSKLL